MFARMLCFALATVCLVISAQAEQSPWRDCTGRPGVPWDQQVKSCTILIDSKQTTRGDRVKAYIFRGYALIGQGNSRQAVADFDEAIKLDPTSALAYVGRGGAFGSLREFDRALADFDQAIKLNPKLAEAYLGRGTLRLDANEYEEAIQDFDQAIKLSPKLAEAYLGRGEAWLELNDLARALSDLSEAIRLAPDSVGAYELRGQVYADQGDDKRAIADFNEAIRRNPKARRALFGRAALYDRSDNFDGAIADWTALVKIVEADDALAPIARDGLGRALQRRGDSFFENGAFDRAIADYEQAGKVTGIPGLAEFATGLARLYSGSPEQALTDLRMASNAAPTNAFFALWVEIVGRRNKNEGLLAKALPNLDMSIWPAPIVRMFLGQGSPADALAAARNADETCQAHFFSGALALLQGAKDEAVRLFRLASTGCLSPSREGIYARAELRALGQNP